MDFEQIFGHVHRLEYQKKEGCRLERRRKREWVWRTVSSRLADRDNRVSPGFHCAGLLQFINRTIV